MNAPDTAKLNDALQAVILQLDEATTAQILRNADWTTAATKGDDKTADKLETEWKKQRESSNGWKCSATHFQPNKRRR